jgi:hypothetical protein
MSKVLKPIIPLFWRYFKDPSYRKFLGIFYSGFFMSFDDCPAIKGIY